MLIPKANRLAVYKYLMQEGVIYAQKDFYRPSHPELNVPNLHVIKLMQSFVSRELVRERFAWQHYYWYITNEGIEFLRTYLNLPSEVVPNTLKKGSRASTAPRQAPSQTGPSGPPGGKEEYRSGVDKAGAPGGYEPSFGGGGFGRGRA